MSASPTWRILIVGHSPSLVSDANVPLISGRSGLTLAEAAGLPLRYFTFLFECVNLFPDVPNIKPSTGTLLLAANALRGRMAGRRAILLGREVARAFNVHRAPVGTWTATPSVPALEVAILPHPSPRNAWWSTHAGRARGAVFLQAEAGHAAGQALDDWPSSGGMTYHELHEIAMNGGTP